MMFRWSATLFWIFVITNTASAGNLYLLTRAANTVKEKVVIPHAGCVVKFDDGTTIWFHFGIRDTNADLKKALKRKWVHGDIRSNTFSVNHVVGFTIPDETLRKAVTEMKAEFAKKPYRWGIRGKSKLNGKARDCVTFATTICRKCGLDTKPDYGTPITMFRSIVRRNGGAVSYKAVKNVDRKRNFQLPWK